MRQFDFYEFMGYIAPGMLLLAGVCTVYPDARQTLKASDLSIGDLGVGIIVAYGVGQVLQAVGNGLDWLWWLPWGGRPTDWLRKQNQRLIAPSQAERVQAKARTMLGKDDFALAPALDRSDWLAIRKEMYAAVAAAGRAKRIDTFNGNYGLCRGIAAGLAIVIAWGLTAGSAPWQVYVGLGFAFALALYRMHRFGVHYAREIFLQFVQLPESNQPDANKKSNGETP